MNRTSRVLAVWVAATTAAGLLVGWLGGAAAAPATTGATTTFTGGLVTGCAAAGAACVTWLWVLVTLVALDLVRGRPARSGVPLVVRRAVLAACGLGLTGALVAPAHADPVPPPAGDAAATSALLVGLPVPDRTTTTTQWVDSVVDAGPSRPTRTSTATSGTDPEVVVGHGDTLWGLARDSLPDDAEPAEIDRRWREIYRANRDAVGADPDLIRPGQRLLLPSEADHR